MKQFSRITAGVAAVMLGIGILLCVIGASRVNWNDFEKVYGFDGEFDKISGKADLIYIDVSYGYISVRAVDENEISFWAENVKEDSVYAEFYDSTFYVLSDSEQEKGLNILGIQIPYHISTGKNTKENASAPIYTLLLPKESHSEIYIHLACGSVEIEGVSADELDIEVKAGEIITTDVSANEAQLECDIGQINATGDFMELDAEVKTGTIVLLLPGSRKDYSYELSCGIGEIQCGSKISGGLGLNKEADEYGEKSIDLSCGIGSILMNFEQ